MIVKKKRCKWVNTAVSLLVSVTITVAEPTQDEVTTASQKGNPAPPELLETEPLEYPPEAADPLPLSATPEPVTHQVALKDTLWKISRQYGVSIDAIKKANYLDSDKIILGRVLVIPIKSIPVATPVNFPVDEPIAITNQTQPNDIFTNQVTVTNVPVGLPVANEKSNIQGLREKLFQEIRRLAAKGVGYNQAWRPPEEKERWVWDCSNTARYLYRRITRKDIGRTASDQYYFLKLKGRIWRTPSDSRGLPDVVYLQKNLQVGDLLFWEHTYKPKRQPPITHVMVFLGKNEKGQWLMAGSQVGGRGEYGNRYGGPDIYSFNPQQPAGGYRTMLGLGRVRGKFVGFGRPI